MKRFISPLYIGLYLCLTLAAVPALAQDTQENAEFKLAVGLYNDGMYELAEDQFTVFIDKFPNTSLGIEARFYMGLLQERKGDYGAARTTFQEFALRYSDNPKAPDAWWHVGEAFEALRNYAEAASAYSRIKTFYPKNPQAPDALLAASRNFLKAGDTHNAKLTLNAITIEYPQSEAVREANLALGEIFITEGEYRKALNEFQRLSSSAAAPAGLKARAIVATGKAQNLMGERQEAEQAFQQVISAYPQTVAAQEAYVLLGDVLRQQGNCASAADNYKRIMDNAEAEPVIRQRAYRGAAECAAAADDFSRATAIYGELFRSFPSSTIEPAMYLNAGRAARKAGNYTQAVTYLETLYEDTLIRADKAHVLAELARTSAEGADYNTAVQRYREFASRYSGTAGAPYALMELATLYDKQFGNAGKALALYAQIVESYGSSGVADDAQYRLAALLEKEGRYSEAAEAYRQFLVQYPASEHTGLAQKGLRSVELFHSGSTDAALKNIAAILGSMNAGNSGGDVDYLLGTLYLEQLKMYSEAEQHFTAAQQKGVAGERRERATYGIAVAVARQFAAGTKSKQEAETALRQYTSGNPAGAGIEEIQYELYMVQSESDRPADILQACDTYLATSAAEHRSEVLLARGRALVSQGRSQEAMTVYAEMLEGPKTDETVRAYYWRAIAYGTNSEFENAKRDLREYLQESPSGAHAAQALYELGKLSVRTGDYTGAVDAFEQLSNRFSYSDLRATANIAMLGALLEAGTNDRARYLADTYWTRARENPFLDKNTQQEYLYQYAVVAARVRDVSAAKRLLLEYIDRFPAGAHTSDVYFALGQIYKDEGKIGLATQYLQRAGAQGGNAAAGREAADLMMDNGNYAGAIKEYRRLAESEESQMAKTYARSRVVVALYRSDNLSEATSEAEQFKSMYPDAETVFDEFLIEQGKYYFRKRQYESAENYFDDAEGSDSKEMASLANYWIGKTYEGRNRNTDAKEKFAEVVEDFPGTQGAMESQIAIGTMALRAEQYGEAAMAFKQVVDIPDLPDQYKKKALDGLIDSYDYLQQYDAAAEMTRRFIEAYPADPTLLRKQINLGQYYYYLRYFDQAIALYERLLAEASPDDQAEIRYYIGESYFHKGDYTQAALEFYKVPALVTRRTEIDWRASALYKAGQSYEKLQKYNLAVEMYRKILSLKEVDPRFTAEARKQIDRVEKLLQ